jgi:ribosomal protein S14
MANLIVVGGKIYARCPECGRLVRLNKPVIGSIHYCPQDFKEPASAGDAGGKCG